MGTTTVSRILAGFLLALVVAGCGGGGGEEGQETTTARGTIPEGTTTTRSESVDAPSLNGTRWMVTGLDSESAGTFTNVWPDSEIIVEFGTDGSVSGNAGCNDYGGSYQVEGPYVVEPGLDEEEGQLITVTDLVATERACESSNIMEQEQEYLANLAEAGRWLIGEGFESEESLLVRDAADERLLIEAIPTG